MPQPGRAHQGHEVPGRHPEVGAPQRPHRGVLRLEGLAHALDHQDVAGSTVRSSAMLIGTRLFQDGRPTAGRRAMGATRDLAGDQPRPHRRVPPFDQLLGQECRLHRLAAQGVHRGLAQYSLPRLGQLLQPLGEIDRVADQGVLQPLLGPEQGGGGLAGREAHSQPEGGQAVLLPRGVDLGLQAVGVGRSPQGPVGVVGLGEGRAEHRHHRVAHELHDGAALAEDGLVHGRPVGVELPGQLAGIGVLGDGRVRADVAHQDGDLDHLGLPDVAAVPPQLLRQAAGEQPGQRLALLLPVDDALVEEPQPADGPLGSRRDSLGQLDEERLDLGVDRLGRGALGGGDGLDRLALGHPAEQGLLGRGRARRGW